MSFPKDYKYKTRAYLECGTSQHAAAFPNDCANIYQLVKTHCVLKQVKVKQLALYVGFMRGQESPRTQKEGGFPASIHPRIYDDLSIDWPPLQR